MKNLPGARNITIKTSIKKKHADYFKIWNVSMTFVPQNNIPIPNTKKKKKRTETKPKKRKDTSFQRNNNIPAIPNY
jgi:hypothetical protein